jgi:hypothetical protein
VCLRRRDGGGEQWIESDKRTLTCRQAAGQISVTITWNEKEERWSAMGKVDVRPDDVTS